jgi:hypothetical protein
MTNWATVDVERARRPKRREGSWWLEAPREGFTQRAEEQAAEHRNAAGQAIDDRFIEKDPLA